MKARKTTKAAAKKATKKAAPKKAAKPYKTKLTFWGYAPPTQT